MVAPCPDLKNTVSIQYPLFQAMFYPCSWYLWKLGERWKCSGALWCLWEPCLPHPSTPLQCIASTWLLLGSQSRGLRESDSWLKRTLESWDESCWWAWSATPWRITSVYALAATWSCLRERLISEIDPFTLWASQSGQNWKGIWGCCWQLCCRGLLSPCMGTVS